MNSLKLILTNIKYFSVVWVFSSLNFIVGTWILYIPYVKTKLSLNDSQIGFALFCLALGILTFLPLVPYLSKKIGLGRLTFFAIVLFALAFIFPVLMPDYVSLCISLFIVGVFTGITDIAMNALVSEIEKKEKVNIMSAAHGFFSLGGVLGAALGSLLMPIFNLPVYHMITVAVLIIFLNILLVKNYFSVSEEQHLKQKNKYSFTIIKPLIAIAFIAFVIMSSEGAIEHWSSLYLIEVVKITQQNLAGSGFIIFSVMMTIGRFFGDGISAKIGSIKIIVLGCILASIGYLCILAGQLTITLLGFSIVGLGLSVIIPELFRIAGKVKGVKASVGISIVSGIGFSGFLLGPVVLGYISNTYNLKISFLTLLLLTFFALLIAGLNFRKEKNS
ncbi:MFS transporter [Polaribacter sp. SA4-10]|uniref:MFS transporter n=1 Tax=Polaribacter sp. SA4-10 TaxID=754397 RepID=UPI000B3CBEAA|nr:MFS transporter [Polaribacter sp. SA4-10]ARV06906.1 MFS transporter [Polaribacter sp. SA4-10]